MGREETVSTIQLDFLSSENFDMKYIAEDGKEHRPAVFHRAPLSTHERFISFLIEYYNGAFPTWMAPVQVCLIPVSPAQADYANEVKAQLFNKYYRVEVDDSDNSFNKRIRTNVKRKIPILLIIGEKERENGEVSIRRYGIEEQETLSVEAFIEALDTEVKNRVMALKPLEEI